ncbi:MAG: hypothetical protein ACQGVC_11825 [Myxococcota bacterium]
MRFFAAALALSALSCAHVAPEPGPGRAVVLRDQHITIEYIDGERSSAYGGATSVPTGRRSLGFVIEVPSEYRSVLRVTVPTACWVVADLREASYRIAYSPHVVSPTTSSPEPSVWLEDDQSKRIARAFCDNQRRKEIPTPCQVVSPTRMPAFNGNLDFPPTALFKGLSGTVEANLRLSSGGTVRGVSDVEVEPREFSPRTAFRRATFARWVIDPRSIVPDRTNRVRIRCAFDHPGG